MLYYLVIVGLVICFAGVVAFGAPYLPTLKKPRKKALDMLDLKEGQTLLELGCGDGRVLRAAAQRGLNAVGIELNPILALVSWIVTFRYRKQVRIVWGNFWRTQWPPADGIFVFLIDKYMPKLDKAVQEKAVRPVKLVSFAFAITGKKPTREKDGVFLYEY